MQWTGTFGRCVASSMFLISRFCSHDQMSSNALDNSCSQKGRQHVGGLWWFLSFTSHVPTPRRNNFKAQGLGLTIKCKSTGGLPVVCQSVEPKKISTFSLWDRSSQTEAPSWVTIPHVKNAKSCGGREHLSSSSHQEMHPPRRGQQRWCQSTKG